jgi:hypothetical protein
MGTVLYHKAGIWMLEGVMEEWIGLREYEDLE